jgi:hypothetical protein
VGEIKTAREYEVARLRREFLKLLKHGVDGRPIKFSTNGYSKDRTFASVYFYEQTEKPEHSKLRNQYEIIVNKSWDMAADDMKSLIAALHELGHVFDATRRGGINSEHHIKYWDRDLDDVKTLQVYEVRAWVYAFYLAKSIGFTEWGAFYEQMKECLQTYSRHRPSISSLARRYAWAASMSEREVINDLYDASTLMDFAVANMDTLPEELKGEHIK